MESSKNKPKKKSKKKEESGQSAKPEKKTTPEVPGDGIPDVDFKKFLGCG